MMNHIVYIVFLMQLNCYALAKKTVGCFPLQIDNCDQRDLKLRCDHYPAKIPNTTQLDIYCPNGIIVVLNAIYSIPFSTSMICSNEDKKLNCSRNEPCYCCKKTKKICTLDMLDTDIAEISNRCDNRTRCSVKVRKIRFKEKDCPSFTWQNDKRKEDCDSTPNECSSRWINIEYECHVPKGKGFTVYGVIIGVAVAFVAVATAIITVSTRKGKQRNPVVEMEDVINPCYRSTSSQLSVRENRNYIPPLKKHYNPSGANNESLLSELNRTLQYQRTCSSPILQPVEEKEDEIYLDTSGIIPYYQCTSRQMEVRENSGYLPPLRIPIQHHYHADDAQETSNSSKIQSVVELEDGVYLDTSVIDPCYQSTSRQREIRVNIDYIPPLKKQVPHYNPSGANNELLLSELRRTLQYQGTCSSPILQYVESVRENSVYFPLLKIPIQHLYPSRPARNASGMQYEDETQSTSSRSIMQAKHQDSDD